VLGDEVRVVVGIGLSSRATAAEVATLVADALAEVGLTLDDVTVIATRESLSADPRLALGPPVTGVPDDVLVAASEPVTRTVGLPARVAETAARLAGHGTLMGPTRRNAQATVAVATARP
jgi:cobalamin biosynthesis protein CbiG